MPFHKKSLLTHSRASFFNTHYCRGKAVLYRDEHMLYSKCLMCGKYYKQIMGTPGSHKYDILLEFGKSCEGHTFTYEELQLCLSLGSNSPLPKGGD